MSDAARIDAVSGRAIVLPGDDLDTDRIIPARFLRAVTFDGLEQHLFEDDRRAAVAAGRVHAFDAPASRGASILIVGANFGCGSSREHAPQALRRWGIRAIVGQSFADIFFGNAIALGLPCLSVSAADVMRLTAACEAEPATVVLVSIGGRSVEAGRVRAPAAIPEPARHALITGLWDATGLLLEDYGTVERVAAALPYVRGF